MSRRERNKADKQERISEAAWALFVERGFEGTTTRAVCERADIGTGTLFSYVDDKTDLLLLVFCDQMQGRVDRAWQELPDAPILEQVVWLHGHLFDFYCAHPELGRHILRAAMLPAGRGRERMAQLNLPFQLQLGQLLEAAVARGELRADLPTPLAATLVFGTYVVALTGFLAGFVPDRVHLDLLFRAAVELQLVGMRRP